MFGFVLNRVKGTNNSLNFLLVPTCKSSPLWCRTRRSFPSWSDSPLHRRTWTLSWSLSWSSSGLTWWSWRWPSCWACPGRVSSRLTCGRRWERGGPPWPCTGWSPRGPPRSPGHTRTWGLTGRRHRSGHRQGATHCRGHHQPPSSHRPPPPPSHWGPSSPHWTPSPGTPHPPRHSRPDSPCLRHTARRETDRKVSPCSWTRLPCSSCSSPPVDHRSWSHLLRPGSLK